MERNQGSNANGLQSPAQGELRGDELRTLGFDEVDKSE
jgi:hypothetical protein